MQSMLILLTTAVVSLAVLARISNAFGGEADSLNRQATYLEGRVGSYVVLNCPLDFPQDDHIPYVLRWFKDVSVRSLFMIQRKITLGAKKCMRLFCFAVINRVQRSDVKLLSVSVTSELPLYSCRKLMEILKATSGLSELFVSLSNYIFDSNKNAASLWDWYHNNMSLMQLIWYWSFSRQLLLIHW